MTESTVKEIKSTAKDLQTKNINWHFHILTPQCQLNDTNKFALILEDTEHHQSWVTYSDQPYMDIGKELVKILHGDDVIKNTNSQTSSETKPSKTVERLLKRAKKLNQSGKFWHHHMLFPKCQFNQHQGSWVIIFEDQENGEVLESVSENEPKEDLKHIETLFYSQKK